MSAAHTTGPWKRDRYGHVIGPDGEDVRFRSLTIAASGSEERIAQAEANTTLIAAAPELLEALIKVAGYLERWADEDECGHYFGIADDAIAKATGGQS